MPAHRAAVSREAPSRTSARASMRRAARASRHRPASRRSSAAPGSFRVTATVMAPSADRLHRRSTPAGRAWRHGPNGHKPRPLVLALPCATTRPVVLTVVLIRGALMFVRKRVVKGRDYYAVVESYRDGARVRHRQIVALGDLPDVPTATQETRREVRRLGSYLTRLGRFKCPPPSYLREREAMTKRLALQKARLLLLKDVLARMPSPKVPSPEMLVQQPPPPLRRRRFRLD